MSLPAELQQAITRELAAVDAPALASAARRLTERYARGEFAGALSDPADRAAYLAVRFPATYAASCKALDHVRERLPGTHCASLLDLGAGAGAATWAAARTFALETVTCVERNPAFAAVGQRLASASASPAVRAVRWLPGDIGELDDLPAHDVVILSYVLGEIPAPQVERLIRAAWRKAGALLLLVEPGTPDSFRRMHAVRELLLESGAHLVAPCPHDQACPMLATGDWCHFAARLPRTAAHRRLKSGSLGYEDEKFSYIAVARHPVALPDARILRHPLIHPGHLRLTLCRPGQPEPTTVTKSQKALWRYARKIAWGDAWEPASDGG
jgi:ribosomal protein RSM22 (predicted rRNA methylase)